MITGAYRHGGTIRGRVYRMSRALVACLLVIQVVCSAFQVTNAYGATVNQGTVKARSGFVRKTSSAKGEVSFCVSSGDVLAILGEEKGSDGNTWYKVAAGNATGYIRSDLLTKTDKKISVSDSLVASTVKQQGAATSQTNASTNATATTQTNVSANTTGTTQATASSAASSTGIVNGSCVRIRSTASTTAGIVGHLNIGDIVNIIGEGKASDGQVWYQIRKDNNTGFVRSDLINKVDTGNTGLSSQTGTTSTGTEPAATNTASALTSTTALAGTLTTNADGAQIKKEVVSGKGTVKGSNVRIRESASTDSRILATANNGLNLVLLNVEAGPDRKWYKIEASSGDKSVSGYIAADYVNVTEEVKEVTTTVVTQNVQAGQQNQALTDSGGGQTEGGSPNDPAKLSQEDRQKLAMQNALQEISNQNKVPSGTPASIKGVGVRVRQLPVDGNVVCQLSSGHPLTISGDKDGSDGYTWYQVSFSYLGSIREGYVRSDLVTVSQAAGVQNAPVGTEEFENSIAALPESYKNSLRTLHAAHPYWTFEAVDTGLDWNESLVAESSVGKNLVSKNSIASWKSTAAQAYNWSTNTWYTFDGGSWASASSELIAYYMDPRNFLNDSGIYMFESLDYSPNQTSANVSKMLTGTFMSGEYNDTDGQTGNYAETFRIIGEMTGVSPYLLAGRCLQEQGVKGTSQSIAGNVPGYEGLFNYFNIGAYAYGGRTATINGLIYASGSDEGYMRPWNTRGKSIYGGAKYLYDKYVSKGQNTLYFQKFNVVNKENTIYSHQYMTNIQAASSESARLALAYLGDDEALHFRIPFYHNMPDIPCEKPTSDSNPNTYLASLSIDGYELMPAFSGVTENYSVTVSPDQESVTINASAVSESSAVGGNGTYPIVPGTNTLYVGCKAQNGAVKVYTITINR